MQEVSTMSSQALASHRSELAHEPVLAQPEPSSSAADAEIARAPVGNPSLWASFRVFLRHGSPRMLTVGFVAFAIARLAVGDFAWWELALPLALVVWQPFQEWLIHVHILHGKPRKILGFTYDPMLAQKHRRHHVDPWQVSNLFIPKRTIVLSAVAHALILGWLLPLPQALTGLLSVISIGLWYEWTHFLIHTAYRPKSTWYRKVWQYHRLHHFKNENYWMGVTTHAGDYLLKTLPEPKSVPLSPTARNLAGR